MPPQRSRTSQAELILTGFAKEIDREEFIEDADCCIYLANKLEHNCVRVTACTCSTNDSCEYIDARESHEYGDRSACRRGPHTHRHLRHDRTKVRLCMCRSVDTVLAIEANRERISVLAAPNAGLAIVVRNDVDADKRVEPYLARSVRREAVAGWGVQNEPARIQWSWNTAVQAAARVHGQWNAAVQAVARVHRPVEGGGAGRRKRARARSQEHARGSGMRRRGCTGRWKAVAAQSVNDPAQGGRRRQQHGGWCRRRGRRKQVHARSQEHARGQWNAAAQMAAGCTGQWKAAAARSVDNEPAHAHGSVRRECGGGQWKARRRGATKTSLRTAHGDGAGGVARGGGRRGRCGASKLSPHMLMGVCAGEFGAAAA
ncbi:hypothetical protein GGX14DRAFT_400484 [Mycena pura]|uniref:Uncharacterized protein n=1 Tax=Mycena pura TaxID=153505 RepID=A0AAD6V326_9AGAR|nr:hypothetical protein GGX14DRAFT_400484 [Mycena pura]